MSIQVPEEVEGTGIDLYGVAKWSRSTIADGKWLQDNTVGPLYENELILASAVYGTSAIAANDIASLRSKTEEIFEDMTSTSAKLQSEIDIINAGSDVIDVVGDAEELSAYSGWTTKNDVIKVLCDSAYDDSQTYYRWTGDDTMDPSQSAQFWHYVGGVSPYYTKSEINTYSAAARNYVNDVSGSLYGRIDEVSASIGDAEAWKNSADNWQSTYNTVLSHSGSWEDEIVSTDYINVTSSTKPDGTTSYSAALNTAKFRAEGDTSIVTLGEDGQGIYVSAAPYIVTDQSYQHTDNNFTTEQKNKLNSIEASAERNVQSDWNVTDSALDSFIKNKPDMSDYYLASNPSGFLTPSDLNGYATENYVTSVVSGKQDELEFDYYSGTQLISGINGSAFYSTGGGTVSGDYLPISGGTMTGKIVTMSSAYLDDGIDGAIDLQNSNIVGVNSIYTSDKANDASEGLQFFFKKTGSGANTKRYYDSLWVSDGAIYFAPNRMQSDSGATVSANGSQKVARLPVYYNTTDLLKPADGDGLLTTVAASTLSVRNSVLWNGWRVSVGSVGNDSGTLYFIGG